MAQKQSKRALNIALGSVGAALVGMAIADQLRRAPTKRTWNGNVLGIPYDFRLPTPERIRDRVWNKNSSRILMPHIFGVGWSINLYPLLGPKTALSI